MGKFTVGRLRPHFLAVCRPNATLCVGREGDLQFSAGLLPYVTDPQCTAPESMARLLRDSRLSFPSGHSSISMFAAVFFVVRIVPMHFPLRRLFRAHSRSQEVLRIYLNKKTISQVCSCTHFQQLLETKNCLSHQSDNYFTIDYFAFSYLCHRVSLVRAHC